jgi:predicted esterase
MQALIIQFECFEREGARHVPYPETLMAGRDSDVHTSFVSGPARREFEQQHITVPRSARYALLGSLDGDLSEVWIVCHGHGQLAARFLTRFLPLERDDRLIIAPEALSRYYLTAPTSGAHSPGSAVGATWMTSEDREAEIADYVMYLDCLYAHIFSRVTRSSVRLWILGFSQGVATVTRWITRSKIDADRVVLWSGSLPPELTRADAAALTARAPLTVVSGRRDEYATPERVTAQRDMLTGLGLTFEMISFDGGHEIDAATLAKIADRSVVTV